MSRLVSPGYKRSQLVNSILTPYADRFIEFKGLNRRSHVNEGEMSDMLNLTSDSYPLLRPRMLRGQMTLPAGVSKPLSIITKYERIAMIAEKTNQSVAFYYDGTEIAAVDDLTADTEMVAINNKICFFPQKTYLQIDRSGSNSYTIGEYGNLAYSTDSFDWLYVQFENGVAKLKTTASSSLAQNFKKGDAINFDCTGIVDTDLGDEKAFDLNNSFVVQNTEEYNVTYTEPPHTVRYKEFVFALEPFLAMTPAGATGFRFTGELARECPDIHHVVEWNNRLWGVSDETNTIYACKLGDPTNWQYYQGTGMDSYYAEQGTDEKWTGVAKYSGHIIFFKPNSMARVYGTAPSNYQITNTICYGIEQGSSRSVGVVNDTVFYKSSIGVMAYDGGTPYAISDKFNCKFANAVGGTEGRKYYISFDNLDDSTHELMTFDLDLGIWHKEDNAAFRDTCTLGGRLYYIEDSDDSIRIINPETVTETSAQRPWMAVFGPFDEVDEDQKIFSRISLRFVAHGTASASVYIKMDDGTWELVKTFSQIATGGDSVIIIPRRCDRFSIKVSGTGDCEIKNLTRRFRRGSKIKP